MTIQEGNEMPYKEEQLSLISLLIARPVMKVAKTRLLSRHYIRLYDYYEVLSFLYESGAILGRSKRTKLSILEKMLEVPGSGASSMTVLREMAEKRLATFKNEVGKEPASFFEFILFRELESAIGLSLDDAFKASTSGSKEVKKAFRERVPLETAEPVIKMFAQEGIGFGASFPELTERMYINAYEGRDRDIWSEARARGLDIPKKPEVVSLEEREEALLRMMTAYAQKYYPELVSPVI
jgi:hypothetical protein